MKKTNVCIKCDIEKDISEFHNLNSKFSKKNYASICKDCKKQTNAAYYQRNKTDIITYSKEYYANNLEKISEKGKIRYQEKIKNNYLSILLSGCRSNARKRNREFNISKQFILNLLEKQENKCYYSGDELSMKPRLYNTLSIDRVNSSKGYTEDNVVLCCQKINVIKNDLSDLEFINLCNKIAEYWNIKNEVNARRDKKQTDTEKEIANLVKEQVD